MIFPNQAIKRISILALSLAVAPAMQADSGAEIEKLAEDAAAVAQGETIYKQMCFACHGMNLEGAAGPNLIDSTWIHGTTPGDWFRVISKGISEKGMMPYEAVYDEATRKNLAAYILSKQEGLRNFQYEIYPPVESGAGLPAFGSGEPIKSGEISDALVDLSPAEMQEFSIVFKGKFLVPKKGKYIFFHQTRDGRFRVKLDDTVSKSDEKKRSRLVAELDAGEHEMEVAYQRTDGTPHLLLFEVEAPSGIKFPLSRDSHQVLATATHVYTVTDRARVVRTALDGIPFESLAVGLSGGLSFTISRDGSIPSVWDGLFLDTGPNVSERGKRPAKTGPPWFAMRQGIQVLVDGKPAALRLQEYRLDSAQSPVFEFVVNDGSEAKVTLRAESSDPGSLTFHYSTSGLQGDVALSIPVGARLSKETDPLVKPKQIPVDDPAQFSLPVYKP